MADPEHPLRICLVSFWTNWPLQGLILGKQIKEIEEQYEEMVQAKEAEMTHDDYDDTETSGI